MPVRVTLAGHVGIEADGLDVVGDVLGRPGRLALAYLACERRRPVPRHELAEVLWGDDLPRSWEQLLRGIVSKLRACLSAAGLDPARALTTAFGAYQIHLPPDATLDVEEAATDGGRAGPTPDPPWDRMTIIPTLGEQRCQDCNTFMAGLGPGGLSVCCGEPVTIDELLSGELTPAALRAGIGGPDGAEPGDGRINRASIKPSRFRQVSAADKDSVRAVTVP